MKTIILTILLFLGVTYVNAQVDSLKKYALDQTTEIAKESIQVTDSLVTGSDMKAVLKEFFVSMLDGIKQAGSFVKEQLPLVLQEYIAWGFWSNLATCVVWLILLFLAIWINIKMHKAEWFEDSCGDPSMAILVPIVLSITSLITLFLVFIPSLLEMIKTVVAPRVYLIEKIAELIK